MGGKACKVLDTLPTHCLFSMAQGAVNQVPRCLPKIRGLTSPEATKVEEPGLGPRWVWPCATSNIASSVGVVMGSGLSWMEAMVTVVRCPEAEENNH